MLVFDFFAGTGSSTRAFEDAGAWIEAMSRRREGGDC